MELFSKVRRLKPKWAASCELAYTDRDKRRYYKYNDMLEMCVSRKGEIDKNLLELRYGSDYTDVVNAMNESLNKVDKGNIRPDIVTLGYLVQELLDRKNLLVVPDLLFKICANTLIREDENPYIVDFEILDEKIDTFKAEIQRGGLHGFFHSLDLMKYLGLSNISAIDLNRLMTDSGMRMEATRRMLNLHTSRLT